MPKIPALFPVVVALLLGLAACGSSNSSSSSASSAPAPSSTTSAAPASGGGGGGAVSVAADPNGSLKYTTSTLTAKAGKVTVKFTNASPLPHNVTIQQGTGGAVVGATPTFSGGGTKTVTLTLKPGTYTFYCSVDGHRAAGMHGTLTVS
jgi:plastocyanin